MKIEIPNTISIQVFRNKWVGGNDNWATKWGLDQAYWMCLGLYIFADEDDQKEWIRKKENENRDT